MWKLAALLFATSFILYADKNVAADPWDKVRDLKTGSDLRIYKTGVTEPVRAQFADVTERKLLVIIKNSETAITKSEIERIDYQPPPTKSRTKTYDATPDSASMSISSGNSREGWQTIYQRPPSK
jgi:hypothetical protein